jgi:hypothetical protein
LTRAALQGGGVGETPGMAASPGTGEGGENRVGKGGAMAEG